MPRLIRQSGQQKQHQQRYVSYFQRQFWDTHHLREKLENACTQSFSPGKCLTCTYSYVRKKQKLLALVFAIPSHHLMYHCIIYQFLHRLRYLFEYILNSYFQLLAASFFDIRSQGVSKVSCTNSYVDLEICMTIPQTDIVVHRGGMYLLV